MQIKPVSQNTFGAQLSRELQSKMIAYGKYLCRCGKTEEYNEMRENAQVIKSLFPDGKILVKPTSKLEIIKDLAGNELFKIPVARAGIFLERYGESDVTLVKNGLLSLNPKIDNEHIREIAARLKSYKHFLDFKIRTTTKEELELTEKVTKDLL